MILACAAATASAQTGNALRQADDLATIAREARAALTHHDRLYPGPLADDFYRLHLERAIEEGLYKLRTQR